MPRRDWNSCRNFQALGTEAAELCRISHIRWSRATLRGTAVPSTNNDATIISETCIKLLSELTMKNLARMIYLGSGFRVLEAESHTTSEFPSLTRQGTKHGFESLPGQST